MWSNELGGLEPLPARSLKYQAADWKTNALPAASHQFLDWLTAPRAVRRLTPFATRTISDWVESFLREWNDCPLKELEQATEVANENALLHAVLGFRLLQQSEAFLADSHTRHALELTGDEPVAVWCRAAVLAGLGKTNAGRLFEKACNLTSALMRTNGSWPEPLLIGLPQWQPSYLRLLLSQNHTNEALLLCREMTGEWEKLSLRHPSNAVYQRGGAMACGWLSALEYSLGSLEASLKEKYKSLAAWRRTVLLSQQARDKSSLATACGTLSYLELLHGQPQKAITAAEEGLAADPKEEWIKINQAHGYLFDSRMDKARAIYVEDGNAMLSGNGSTSMVRDKVLADFKTFREKGINHPDMEKFEALLKTKP
jgi:hypothetical protein